MVINWSIDYFAVQTGTASKTTDKLYANGRMQVPVYVSIRATYENDKKERKPYTLTGEELSSIQLVDYYCTDSVLSSSWSYSVNKSDEFYHNFPSSLGASAAFTKAFTNSTEVRIVNLNAEAYSSDDDSSPTTQYQTYWVTTTAVENKGIAASIKQPDKTIVTTSSSTYDSKVTLTGVEPITYTDNNVSVTYDNTASGTWEYDWQSAWDACWYTAQNKWDQNNCYVTSRVHAFKNADIWCYDRTGYENGHQGDSCLTNCYAYYAENDKNLHVLFIWDFGNETTKKVGIHREQKVHDWGQEWGRRARAYADIEVNQNKGAVCLTRVAFECGDTIWGTYWHYNCGFRVYDVYGNTGTFSVSYTDNRNQVVIKNSNK